MHPPSCGPLAYRQRRLLFAHLNSFPASGLLYNRVLAVKRDEDVLLFVFFFLLLILIHTLSNVHGKAGILVDADVTVAHQEQL